MLAPNLKTIPKLKSLLSPKENRKTARLHTKVCLYRDFGWLTEFGLPSNVRLYTCTGTFKVNNNNQ